LQRCLAAWQAWQAQHRIEAFSLGEHDTPDRLLIPEKLYGRAREVETLLAAFDRVVESGTPELILVSGYSGIGKSAVVNELHKALVPPRGLFASGKFDQYTRNIPYASLAQAFQSLVRSLLSKSAAELDGWRHALLEALGPNGQLMVDLMPELRLIIGDQPPVPELEPQQGQRRFQLVIRRFIGVFAQPAHPLALFLDDLQWLDAATLDLLEDLLTQPDLRNLMLIGAYRDNEVSAAHPLMRKLDAIKAAGGKVAQITLAPLTRKHLGQLIADALRCGAERAAPLAQLVHEKTGGNPFFAIQFLSSLAEEEMLTFDHDAACWSWDLKRIHAKRYTDNVVELMVGKLTHLPAETQKALQLLACLGINAEIGIISIILETAEAQVHAVLWEAARQEFVVRLADAYQFIHDRVQEAAYSLIPDARRAEVHLRIGRLLAARTSPEKRGEVIFGIVNQLNLGAALITTEAEREQVAALNLLAGRRAKQSTAYASALSYLAAGRALLPEDAWERQYELVFALELSGAECEFLASEQAEAETRLAGLARRAANLLDLAAVTQLRVELFTTLGQSDRAVGICLDYLRHVGIAWSAHPTREEARKEFEGMRQQLGERPIEALLDLPRMADPGAGAVMDVLTAVASPALFTDENLLSLVFCRMAQLSLEHGNSDGSCLAYVWFGMFLGSLFGDYKTGFRFAQLGLHLVEQRGMDRFKARVYMMVGSLVIPWTKPIRTGRSLVRRAFDVAQESGDLIYAAYSRTHFVAHLLASGDPLGEIQQQAEAGLDFARQARFGLVADRIAAQLQLIRTLRGLTPIFGRLDDAGFDEKQFERHLHEDPCPAIVACRYWIRKLQARVFASDDAAAIAAAEQAERLLWTSPSFFELAEYHFYAALAYAALCDAAPAPERSRHLEVLAAHHRQLQQWAENCPENFENRAALVGAEIARLEGRDVDAMRLYEQAIRSARENGFVHNHALAYELAARFYAALGLEKIAQVYLRDARYGYLCWGANGKVRQLDQLYPYLREEERAPASTSTIGTPVEQLDLATVIKVSQTVSGEIVLEKLLDTLLRTAIEHAGAARGLLVMARGAEPRIAAEARIDGGTLAVRLCDEPMTAAMLPEAVLHYVLRTRESVILDDAAAQDLFAADPYIRQRQARSVLALPLLTQANLIGALYLENNLAPRVFAQARITVLKLLASQAAIALENTRLYREVAEREAKIRRLVDANIIGIGTWQREGQGADLGDAVFIEVNDAFLHMVGYDREDLASGRIRRADLTPLEWRDRTAQAQAELMMTGTFQPYEKEYFRKDGSRVPVLIGAASFDETHTQGVVFVLDLTERKRAEEAVRKVQMELAHANRVATMGQLTSSIAHEVSQPIAATIISAQAALHWLGAEPPALEEVRQALERIVKNGSRAGEVIDKIRAIIKKAPPRKERLDINEAIREV
ncbi:MAG TPA: AAA family ATPase, partial [Burkholderiales bacterium]|nr:AAA family ATPase [Burkholderiales bacterium]